MMNDGNENEWALVVDKTDDSVLNLVHIGVLKTAMTMAKAAKANCNIDLDVWHVYNLLLKMKRKSMDTE